MAYAHFEDHDEVIVSTKLGTNPQELADFILGSVVKTHASKQLKIDLKSLTGRDGDAEEANLIEDELSVDDLSPMEASKKALEILRDTTEMIEKHIRNLQMIQESGGSGGSGIITTPEIMKRFKAVTSASSSSTTAAVPRPVRERVGSADGRGYGSVDENDVIEMPLKE